MPEAGIQTRVRKPSMSYPPSHGRNLEIQATDLGFTLITDQETKKSVYNFWIRVASALTDLDAARECDADNAGAGNE